MLPLLITGIDHLRVLTQMAGAECRIGFRRVKFRLT